ncbi:hypothetical protein Trydic_g15335 [Trypoxylus dichotomus]
MILWANQHGLDSSTGAGTVRRVSPPRKALLRPNRRWTRLRIFHVFQSSLEPRAELSLSFHIAESLHLYYSSQVVRIDAVSGSTTWMKLFLDYNLLAIGAVERIASGGAIPDSISKCS